MKSYRTDKSSREFAARGKEKQISVGWSEGTGLALAHSR